MMMKKSLGKMVRDWYWWAWVRWPRNIRYTLSAHVMRQANILKVCSVYPKKVSVKSMDNALHHLDLDPEQTYLTLARGDSIPKLDEALQEETALREKE